MNELNEIDKALLESIKTKVENLAGLSANADLSQKDFDFLLYYIQEKTGQALSLTTLKRIWRKEYHRLPHLSTLNMLAQIAYNIDWHTAKKRLLEDQSHDHNPVPASAIARPSTKRVFSNLSLKILVSLAALISLSWYYVSNQPSGDATNIQFSAQATNGDAIPNSVVFSYDVNSFRAKHFYIQQSWDPAKIVEISPANRKQTDIYYEPGYHYAKLLGDQKVLKEIPVHIKYNDWYVRFRYPDSELVQVRQDDLHTAGYLGLEEDYIQRFKPLDTKFQMGFMLSKDFNFEADELQLEASARFDSAYAPSCPMVNLLVKGNKDYAWITVGNKGCESNLGVRVSDTNVNGKTNDLSMLGIDAFSWQKLHVKLSNGKLTLSINNKVVQESTYTKSLGELKEIDLFFNGIGSIADVRIGDDSGHGMITAK
jgi:hypothetical protein